MKRECRVRAAEQCEVMFLHMENVYRFFGNQEIEQMLRENFRFNKEQIKEKVI